MLRAAILALSLAATLGAGCGPRAATPPGAEEEKAALVVVAPSAGELDRAIELLAPLGGAYLATVQFAVTEPWPTAVLAERGLATDAPLGVAITRDGVEVRWAAITDAGRLRTALDRVPGAARWRADGGELWRIADTAIAVVAGDQAAVVTGGAPSRRDRVALALASRALDVRAAPAAAGLALEVDGTFLIDAIAAEPGPLVAGLGPDLGRIRVALAATTTAVVIDVSVQPRAGSLAEQIVAGAHGAGLLTPRAVFAVTTHLPPAQALALLTELGPARGVDVPAAVQALPLGARAITGGLGLAPGMVSIQFADADSMDLAARLLPGIVQDRAPTRSSFVVGGASGGDAGSAGLTLHPEVFAILPALPPAAPPLPTIDDGNTDVPWTQDYREARKQLDAAVAGYESAIGARKSAIFTFRQHRGLRLGRAVAVPLLPAAGGFRGHAEWRPERGSIADSIEAANDGIREVVKHGEYIATAHAKALAAHQHALEIRAADVVAWDRAHRP